MKADTAIPIVVVSAALTFVVPSGSSYAADNNGDNIDTSLIQQGFDASPIPPEKLNLMGKSPAMVGLGSYLVNGAAKGAGEVGTNRYRYANTDDCPNNLVNGAGKPNVGDDGSPDGVSPPQ